MIETDCAAVKVLIGEYGGINAPIQDEITQINYLDVQLGSGQTFEHALPESNHTFIYVFEGEVAIGEHRVQVDELLSLSGGVHVNSANKGARFLLVSGMPIEEPIVQYGPFVMNTREEIDQAMQDYQSNNFVSDRAWINKIKVQT